MKAPSSRRLAIITDPAMPELQPDDLGLPAAFGRLGVEAEALPWGAPCPPERYGAALVRTPWEYFLQPDQFLTWIESLEVQVLNAPEVLRWNHDKRYLLELAGSGAARIPATALVTPDDYPLDAEALLRRVGAERGVLKPTVSGGAWRTSVLTRGGVGPSESPGEEGQSFLVQAFVEELPREGEWSLTFLGGEFSHAVLKRAGAGDFRVQEEHGGTVESLHPPAELVREARQILHAAPGAVAPLYGRVDLVEAAEGRPYLMELELIEPELFLRARPGAAADLAALTAQAAGL